MVVFLAGANIFDQISDATDDASTAQATADDANSTIRGHADELLDLTDRIERLEARPYGY